MTCPYLLQSLVYTMRALKLTEGSSTLPSALLESASKESLHKKSLKSFQNFRKNSLAMLRKAASTNSVGSASSNFRMADSPALTGEADKEIVFEWLRNEYSNYGRKSSFATSSGSAGSFKGRELTGPPSAGPTNSPFASPAFIRRPHCPTRIDGMGCYEPTKKELKAINEALEGVNEWDWDVFKLSHASNGHPIQVVGWHVLSQWGLIESFEIDEQKLRLWLAYIESQYVDTPYHNKIHASDVTQTVHAMLATGGLREYLTESQVLALLLTAIAHDVGHDGLNNKYHKNARSERAMTFNDQSIQENYHLRVIFESMRTHSQIDLFEGLDEDVITELRDMMIRMVLHTDMSTHFVALKEFNTIAEKNGSSVDLWKSNSHSDTLMSHVLHCCDLSGQAKKQSLAEIWSQRCIEEFFIQGDKEKDKGLPISPLCDRTTTPVAESQVGFIQYVVLPAYQALARVLPTADLHVVQLRQNSAYWESRKDESVFK
mmetsp:Transcript_14325/g.22812  ORF Transcript_14325/g.22812 Transcript_14325/m.22812 type:complete len:488 (-) Transcript_14325:42-1505(-)